MDINIEQFFKSFPTMSHPRNRFPWKKTVNFNMKVGEITPLMLIRTAPGVTYNLDLATILKCAPMQVPPQDDAVYKVFAFYQADRNTWNNYPYWFGEKQKPENPEEEPTYLVPKVTLPKGGFAYNSFYDNIGCPPEVGNYKIDAFIPRADRQIYNTYFRNQTLENPLDINLGDEDDDPNENMQLRKICKPRDYFTQGLPTVSGTTPVEIPLGSTAPVIGNGTVLGFEYRNGADQPVTRTFGLSSGGQFDDNGEIFRPNLYGQPVGTGIVDSNVVATSTNRGVGVTTDPTASGLIADLSKAMGAPLQGLYQAIAYNTLQYITSRTGERYFERLSNIYGVVNPDGVLRQPEFLGSTSQLIEFDTITQTSSTTGQESPLGHRASNGYCESYGENLITKSFGEFGWIFVYGVITLYPKYQQGVSRLMQTEDPLELFNPIFNYMGDEEIKNSEIYVQDDEVVDEDGTPINDKPWAYGKRNSKMLYPIDEIHGEQRSSYSQSLDFNHFAEYYSELPNLNKEFDKINDSGFKRSLQLQEETQFVGNCMMTGTIDIEIPTEALPQPMPLVNFNAK